MSLWTNLVKRARLNTPANDAEAVAKELRAISAALFNKQDFNPNDIGFAYDTSASDADKNTIHALAARPAEDALSDRILAVIKANQGHASTEVNALTEDLENDRRLVPAAANGLRLSLNALQSSAAAAIWQDAAKAVTKFYLHLLALQFTLNSTLPTLSKDVQKQLSPLDQKLSDKIAALEKLSKRIGHYAVSAEQLANCSSRASDTISAPSH